jgi:putative Ca2+/H+ antiporter (TMEM165/GDT1 family)
MLSVLLVTYSTVLVLELLGDKTLYTISALATRYRPWPLLLGITAAFMAKMSVAVLFASVLGQLSPAVAAGLSAVTFFGMAILLWRRVPDGARGEENRMRPWPQVTLLSFTAVFCTEWGDIGQITTAALAIRYHAFFVVWLGATLALITKGLLAMTVGITFRRYLPAQLIRYVAISLCLLMGVMATLRVEF